MKIKYLVTLGLIIVLILLITLRESRDLDSLLARGDRYFKSQRYDRALDEYIQAAVTYPGFRETYLKMGLCSTQMFLNSSDEAQKDNFAWKAKKFLTKASDTGCTDVPLYTALERVYGYLSEDDKYENSILRLIELAPLEPGGYRLLSRYYMKLKYWGKALGLLQKQLWALVDPGIIAAQQKIKKLEKDIETFRNTIAAIPRIMKLKEIDETEQKRFLDDYRARLAKLPPLEPIKELELTKKQMLFKMKSLDDKLSGLNPEDKRKAANIYFTMSTAHLNMLKHLDYPVGTFLKLYKKGWTCLEKSIRLHPDTNRAKIFREKYLQVQLKWLHFKIYYLRRSLAHARMGRRR